jgi:hypothetical protein
MAQRTWKRAVRWLLDTKRRIATKEHLTAEERKQLGRLNKSLEKYFPVRLTTNEDLERLFPDFSFEQLSNLRNILKVR